MNRYFAQAIFALTFVGGLSSAAGQTGKGAVGNAPHGGAVVLDLSGKVNAHASDGGKLNVLRNGTLPEGTVIDTDVDAKILLRLEDGSEILLQPSSRLALKPEALPTGATLFEFLLGRLRAIVTKRFTGTPSFQLGTPSAIVAVRGTQFEVEVNAHKVTEVDVEQGVVQVTSRNAPDRFVILEPGFSTRVGPDMVPEPPVPTNSMRPDVREEAESKAKKPKGANDDRHRPSTASPDAGQGVEPTEPTEPTEPAEPAEPLETQPH